jgi:hypothetical protein
MITVYCALYPEAQELIGAFELKKETAQRHFQVFSNEAAGMRVVLTGAGSVAAATAVAELSTCYPPKKTDLLINFGSCAAGDVSLPGQIFLCNKITEACSGRTFYPDVLYRHPFAEAAIVSTAKVMSRKEMRASDELCDMEAAAVYQAGNYYYSPHQMLFIKAVVDHGMALHDRDFSQDFTELMKEAGRRVCPYVERLCKLCDEERESAADHRALRQQAAEDGKELGEQLHCSVTMAAELGQLLFYCRLTGREYDEILESFRRQGRLPAKDKREGKKLIEELKSDLL